MGLSFYAALLLVAVVVHVAVAALVLVAGPRRLVNWIVFTYVGLLSGSALALALEALAFDGLLAMDPDRATTVFRGVRHVLEWPGSLFVLALALHYPENRLQDVRVRRVMYGFFVFMAVMWVWVFFDRELFYSPPWFQSTSHLYTFLLDDVRYWLTMYAAWLLLGLSFLKEDPGKTKTATFLFLAFIVAPLTAAVPMAIAYGQELTVRLSAEPIAIVKPALTVMGSIGVVPLVAAILWTAWRRGRPIGMLLTWSLVALAFGTLGATRPAWLGIDDRQFVISFLSNWGSLTYLVVRPLLLGYAMVRYGALGIPASLRQGLSTAFVMVIAGAVFLPVEEAVRQFSGLEQEIAVPMGTAAGIAVVFTLFHLIQNRTSAGPEWAPSRYDVYRTALQNALAGGIALTPAQEADLAQTRHRLGISDDQHRALLADVASASTGRRRGEALGSGTLLLGRYRIERPLGHGGSGHTYACHDIVLDRVVAVKRIDTAGDPATHRRALREARALAGVRHDHVVGIHDVVEAGDEVLLVMELVDGGSIADRLQEGPLPAREARERIQEILRGLTAVHERGIVHRDLKPSNILLDPSRGAIVADLGIARGPTDQTVTRLQRAGTPAYMAPEQLLDHDVDARTDLYSAAAVLYEMLTGRSPVREAVRVGMLVEEAILSGPPPVLGNRFPQWAHAFIQRAMAKDPADRFPDAGAALTAISSRRGTAAGSGRDAARRRRPGPPRSPSAPDAS